MHIFLLDPKPSIFTERLLWAGCVLGAEATVAKTEAIGSCLQVDQVVREEANRHRSNHPAGECGKQDLLYMAGASKILNSLVH